MILFYYYYFDGIGHIKYEIVCLWHLVLCEKSVGFGGDAKKILIKTSYWEHERYY
jgi:hypothetical protein